MTIIACDRQLGIVMADTLISGDENRSKAGYAVKIFRSPDGRVGGAAGGANKCALFNDWLAQGRPGNPVSEWFVGDDAAEGLVLTPDREILWYMSPYPDKVITENHAIGYGATAFMAASMAGADIYHAIKIACELSGICGSPFTELKIERRSKPKRSHRKS